MSAASLLQASDFPGAQPTEGSVSSDASPGLLSHSDFPDAQAPASSDPAPQQDFANTALNAMPRGILEGIIQTGNIAPNLLNRIPGVNLLRVGDVRNRYAGQPGGDFGYGAGQLGGAALAGGGIFKAAGGIVNSILGLSEQTLAKAALQGTPIGRAANMLRSQPVRWGTQVGAVNAAYTPSDQPLAPAFGKGFALGAGAGVGLGGMGAAAGIVSRGTSAVKNALLGGDVQGAADKFYNALSDGAHPDVMNENLGKAIYDTHQTNLETAQEHYDKASEMAAQLGYDGDKKSILIGKNTQDLLGKIQGKEFQPITDPSTGRVIETDPDAAFKMPSQDSYLNKAINDFNKNPSYENAHKLQSGLGRVSSDYRSGSKTAAPDANVARFLNSARDSVNKDISNTFANNGDTHLEKLREIASDYWKNSIKAPLNIPGIRKIVDDKVFPKNIVNTLKDPNYSEDNNIMLQNLSENPKTANTLLAKSLAPAATKTAKGTYETNPDKLSEIINNLNPNIKKSISPALQKDMQDIAVMNAFRKKRMNLYKGLGWAGGVAAGLGTGYEALKNL